MNRRNLAKFAVCSLLSETLRPAWEPIVVAQETQGEKVPKNVGRKFSADGQALPFAGNTIISHLPHDSAVLHQANALAGDLRRLAFHKKMAVLPADSYHVTIFGGANDQGRRLGVTWPSDIAVNIPIAECNRLLSERLRNFRLECSIPFRFRIDQQATSDSTDPCTIRIAPLNDGEAQKLRQLRERLSDVFKFRAADHDTYRYHITLAYLTQSLTGEEQTAYQASVRNWTKSIHTDSEVVELNAPEFCTFKDMLRFDIEYRLRP